jgi:hypothetical protein
MDPQPICLPSNSLYSLDPVRHDLTPLRNARKVESGTIGRNLKDGNDVHMDGPAGTSPGESSNPYLFSTFIEFIYVELFL